MRAFVALLLMACGSAAHARGMNAVPENVGFCVGKAGTCHEWSLASDPSIRFIAHGFEDGIEYAFHRKRPTGEYEYLVRVYPVLRDATRAESFYWGYPRDIDDVVVDSKGALLATFGHELFDDGNVESLPWQKRIPAVLFIGRTTQPDIKVPKLRFRGMTVPALQKEAAIE